MPRLQMSRRVSFSSGHRYWCDRLSPEDNRARFGPWASPYSHGHNYVLEVTVEGDVEPSSGMIVNIKIIDDILQERVVAVFDGRSINDEVPDFRETAPSTENLLLYFARDLGKGRLPPQVTLTRLELTETPLLRGTLDTMSDTMTLTRVYEFAASHRLHAPALSAEQNLDIFGKCNNPAGHGHNYVLEVTVEGKPDPDTGMLAPLEAIDRAVHELVVDRYDHKNLNCDLPEFQDVATTSENVALEIFRRLEGKLPARLHGVKLYETARSSFQVLA